MPKAYPLEWPAGRPREKYPMRNYRFGGGKDIRLNRARDEMHEELRMLGASNVVISTNRPTRIDGEFCASSAEPADSGVAVYFTLRGKPMCFACDRWDRMAENVWAIAKTINALRGIERWGVGEAMQRAFHGFEQLPDLSGRRDWWQILGLTESSGEAVIRARKIELNKRYHPDLGNGDDAPADTSGEARAHLQAIIEKLRK